METMDLDTLDARLPDEVMTGGGTMVGCREIFPWVETLKFTREGEEWFADDQHCVRPGCTGTETGLAFLPRASAEHYDRRTAAAPYVPASRLRHWHHEHCGRAARESRAG